MEQILSAPEQGLMKEAKMQADALRRLGIWLRASLSLMSTGLLMAWWGFGMGAGFLRGVSGIILALAGAGAAFVIRLGRSHGKKNVERILAAANAQSLDACAKIKS